jgi:hypothetical protein
MQGPDGVDTPFVWADHTRVVPSTPSSLKTLLSLSIPPGGGASPHSLALTTSDLHLCMGPHSMRMLWEHRKQSVSEFYLPSRLLPHSPQFTLLTLGKTRQDLWERPKRHLHETETHHIKHTAHYISQKTSYIEYPNITTAYTCNCLS